MAKYTKKNLEFWNELEENIVEAVKEAVKISADEVKTDAKNRCPEKTGKLKNSIKTKNKLDGLVVNISASAKDKNGYDYAKIVEFHPVYGKSYLYGALYDNNEKIINNISTAFNEAIKKR